MKSIRHVSGYATWQPENLRGGTVHTRAGPPSSGGTRRPWAPVNATTWRIPIAPASVILDLFSVVGR